MDYAEFLVSLTVLPFLSKLYIKETNLFQLLDNWRKVCLGNSGNHAIVMSNLKKTALLSIKQKTLSHLLDVKGSCSLKNKSLVGSLALSFFL